MKTASVGFLHHKDTKVTKRTKFYIALGVLCAFVVQFGCGECRDINNSKQMPMGNPAASEKNLLRELMRGRRRQLDPAWKAAASQAIISRLEALHVFQQARVIHVYVAWRNEVDTHDLIRRLLQEERRVAVPKVETATGQLQHYFIADFSKLQKGAFGILESPPDPDRLAAPSQFDLVLVPGLAFDRAGNRLGMGKGHYARFLAEVHAPKIALAYDFQIVERILTEPHDQRVDMIVTEHEIIDCSQFKIQLTHNLS